MFQQEISTQFNTTAGSEVCPFVIGVSPYDGALHSVLRATLYGKIGEEMIVTRFAECDFNGNRDEDVICEEVAEGSITFISNVTNHRIPDWVSDMFLKTHEGWEKVNRVSSFFERIFDCICFINTEKKSTVVFVGRLDTGRMHYILCSVFAMLPWYYSKETVTPDDIELVKSLREPTPAKFNAAIAVFEEKYDFYTMSLGSLNDFETDWQEREVSRMQQTSDSFREKMASLYHDLAEYQKQKEAIDRQILGWKLGNTQRDYSLKQYLIDNSKNVRYMSSNEDGMTVEIITELMYFDEDIASDVYGSARGLIDETYVRRSELSKEDMKLLFKALFIDKTATLRFCAGYRLNVNRGRVDGITDFDFDSAASKCLPNPHINRYACIGGYEQGFIRCMSTQNYVGAIEQAIVSCQSLNFADGTVMEEFMRRLYETDKKCIVIDGRDMTTKEAVDEIKKKGEE